MKHSILLRFSTLAATALVLGACGDGSDDEPTPDGGAAGTEDPQQSSCEASVGVLPFAEVAPFYLAMSEGLFEAEGITVEAQAASTGATLISTLSSGDTPIIYSNYPSLLTAASQGLPIRIFRENDRPASQAIYVSTESGVSDPQDLEGKRLAVNGLGNVMELTSRSTLEAEGVDSDAIQFVELPPPNMLSGLETGQIDAAWLVEPFITQAEGTDGIERLIGAFEGPNADLPVAGWATSEKYVNESADCLARFDRALTQAMEMVEEDPSLAADMIPTYTQIPAEVAANMTSSSYVVDSDLESIKPWDDLLIEYEVITEPTDWDTILVDTEASS